VDRVPFKREIGQLEPSGNIVWNNDGETLDEEDSPCGIGPIVGVSCWEVIREGDGPSELG